MSQPSETGSEHHLPFDQLSAADFELLCFWLAKREGFTDIEHIGAGGADRGRDLVAKRGGRSIVFQCKNYKAFHPKDARKAVEEALGQLTEAELPDEIILAVPANLTEAARESARSVSERRVTFWDKSFLDERVREYPELRARFFRRDGRRVEDAPAKLVLEDLGLESPLWDLSKHYLRFALSKVGVGTVWIDRITLEIIEVSRLEQLHAPREGAVPQVHQDSIRLSADKTEYALFSGRFYHYTEEEPEVFRVELTSDEGFEYRVQARVDWHLFGRPSSAAASHSLIHAVRFPITSDEGALELLRKMVAPQ